MTTIDRINAAHGHPLFNLAASIENRRNERRNRRAIAAMRALPSNLLCDVGLTPQDIDAALAMPNGRNASAELARRKKGPRG